MIKKHCIKLSLMLKLVSLTITASYGQASFYTNNNNWELALKNALVKPDSNKIKLLLKIADTAMLHYFNGRENSNLIILLKLINSVTAVSNTINYTTGYNRCLLLKSGLLYIQNQDSAATILHKAAIPFYKNASAVDMADAFYFLSESWKYRRHYQQIIIADSVYYLKALAYYKSVNDNLKTASLYRAIAIIHSTNGQLLTAIKELQDLYKFQVQINDSSRHKTTDMLAHCYAINGNFKEAIFYFQQSLKYADEIKDSTNICLYYYRAGRINYNVHETAKGTAYMMQALRLAELQKDTFLCIHISFIICKEGLMEAGKYQEGLNKTLDIIKNILRLLKIIIQQTLIF